VVSDAIVRLTLADHFSQTVELAPRSSDAVARRRGQGFKGKGGVGGARECEGQLLTALCRGWLDVGELTQKLGKC